MLTVPSLVCCLLWVLIVLGGPEDLAMLVVLVQEPDSPCEEMQTVRKPALLKYKNHCIS